MVSQPSGKPRRRLKHEVRVVPNDHAPGVSTALVRRAALAVLDGEAVGNAHLSVTFLSGPQMRGLNRRMFDIDRATDVIAFPLPHPGLIVGDVYVCPGVARRSAQRLNITESEEIVRLVIHGTLHVLGYDHPEGDERVVSLMWRQQERYVSRVEEKSA